jgi:hypothetical protein
MEIGCSLPSSAQGYADAFVLGSECAAGAGKCDSDQKGAATAGLLDVYPRHTQSLDVTDHRTVSTPCAPEMVEDPNAVYRGACWCMVCLDACCNVAATVCGNRRSRTLTTHRRSPAV